MLGNCLTSGVPCKQESTEKHITFGPALKYPLKNLEKLPEVLEVSIFLSVCVESTGKGIEALSYYRPTVDWGQVLNLGKTLPLVTEQKTMVLSLLV